MSADRSTEQAAVGSLDAAATTPTRGRKRPLRTYSRRSAQARAPEQDLIPKDGGQAARTPSLERAASPDRLPALTARQEERAERPSRASILAYFKPLPPSSDRSPSDIASSDPAEPPSTPPTSPPSSRARKRRRLTTRPLFSGLDQHSRLNAGDVIQVGEDDSTKKTTVEQQQQASPSKAEATIIVGIAAHTTPRPALSEVPANTLEHDGPAGSSGDGGTRTKKRPDKRPARDMTQTTLSLSVHKEPGFTMCGVCDILYNPLNEKDRREHNRRHAAFSRSKRRTV